METEGKTETEGKIDRRRNRTPDRRRPHLQSDGGSLLQVQKGDAAFHLHEGGRVSRSDHPGDHHLPVDPRPSAQRHLHRAVIGRAVLPWLSNDHGP